MNFTVSDGAEEDAVETHRDNCNAECIEDIRSGGKCCRPLFPNFRVSPSGNEVLVQLRLASRSAARHEAIVCSETGSY